MRRTFVSALTVALAASSSIGQPARLSPLVSMDDAHVEGIVECTFDEAAYRALKGLPELRMIAFPTPIGPLDLDLIAFDVLTPDAQVVVGTAAGDVPTGRPDVVLLRGSVMGVPGSHVFLGLSPLGSNGWIRLGPHQQIIIASTMVQGVRTTAIYDLGALPGGAIKWAPFECDTIDAPIGAPPEQRAVGTTSGDNPICRRVMIAVETDFEFTDMSPFNGNTTASMAYAYTLIGAVAEIYRRDFDAQLAVPFLRVWAANTDPYSGSTASERLSEFRQWWNSNMGHVERNNAQMLSGIRGGGLAYLRALCGGIYSYAISSGMTGSFPYPLQHNSAQNRDVFILAHEMGHCFGAPHTHSMCPPIDQCARSQFWGPCQTQRVCTSQGTIMSYCSSCAGGMANIRLEFHQRMIDEKVLPYLGSTPCASGECSACYADCDQSTGVGVLDIIDFLCFQNAFVSGTAYACDCDTSTGPLVCDLIDFLCFQDAFVAGCP